MTTSKKHNVIFLDYDGVISIPSDNFKENIVNEQAIKYLNQLCLDFDFDLVISSSWRKYPKYKDLFYSFGIDKDIKILGCTEINNKGRVEQVRDYIKEHEHEIASWCMRRDCRDCGGGRPERSTDRACSRWAGRISRRDRKIHA